MATYEYSGITHQLNVNHPNRMVALKVDVLAGGDKISILAETVANAAGAFTLSWEDWTGRVIIGAVDDDGVVRLDCVFRDFQAGSIPLFEYRDLILEDTPFLYYELDETGGTIVVDSSGNGNNGTYNNSPTLTQTTLVKTGTSSVLFNGVDDYIEAAPTVQPTGNFAWECWYKTTQTGETIRLMDNRGTGLAEDVDGVQLSASSTSGFGNTIISKGGGSSDIIGSSGTPFVNVTFFTNGTLHHVVLQFNQATGTLELFQDGVLAASQTNAAFIGFNTRTTKPFRIAAASNDPASQNYDGQLDEVVIYDRLLTPQEIKDHYQFGFYGAILTDYQLEILNDGPQLFWPLDETSGTTVYDLSGNNINGTYYNEPLLAQPGLSADGTSVKFNGSDQYIRANGSSGLIDFYNKLHTAVEGWFKLEALVGTQVLLRHIGLAGDINNIENIQYSISVLSSGALRYEYEGTTQTNTTYTSAAGTIVAGETYHIVVNHNQDNGILKMYLNGALLQTFNFNQNPIKGQNGHLYIANSNEGQLTACTADNIAIYWRELTDAEIASHYTLGAPPPPPPTINNDITTEGGIQLTTEDGQVIVVE